MSCDRSSEPRRSPSGRRPNYSGRRDGRADRKSPDFRRGGDYHKRIHQCRSPEYGDRYKRRSISAPRHCRDTRAYRGGRTPPYRRSRTRSPWRRRSRSVDSYSRNGKYFQGDAPSARFGSKASYLRSRDAHRARSRSPSHCGRPQSPFLRERGGRRNVGDRSESRGRYRDRREDVREWSRRRPSRERRVLRNRTPDRCEPYYKGRTTRVPSSPNRPVNSERHGERRASQHDERRRHSSIESVERKASPPSPRSSLHDRRTKRTRSRSPSTNGSRKGVAATPRRRSQDHEGGSLRRGGKPSRERGSTIVCRRSASHTRSPHQRFSSRTRQNENETPIRHSADRGRRSRQRSASELAEQGAGTPTRAPLYRGGLSERSGVASEGRTVVEASRGSPQRDQRSNRRSSSLSADCPTPDLASSRSFNDDSERTDFLRHSSAHESKRGTTREASLSRGDVITAREKHGSRSREGSWDRQLRRRASLSRSRSLPPRNAADEHDETKDRKCSVPVVPPAEEPASFEKEPKGVPKTCQPPSVPENLGQDEGTQDCEAFQQQKEASPTKDDDEQPTDSKGNRCPSLPSADRRPSEGRRHGGECHSPEPTTPEDTAVEAAEPRHGQSTKGSVNSDEGAIRSSEARKTVVKRKIVATGTGTTPTDAEDTNRAPRESPRRRYFRSQHQVPETGDRHVPPVNRLQPLQPYRWNRFERVERFDFPQAQFPRSGGRSVRLVGGFNDRTSFFSPQHHRRNITPNEGQRRQLHNGFFQRTGYPQLHIPQRGREPIQFGEGGSTKLAGILGRGPPGRRQAAAASTADGKWNHDLFEQLSNEPERKRRRFNLYGETLERVDD